MSTEYARAAQPLRNATADRAIDVLMLFSDSRPVITAADVGQQLGMSRSTTYRYLQSLRSAGLLEDDPARGGFRLGPLIFQLGRIARRGLNVPVLARPAMRRMAEETGETVLLTRRSGSQVICLERVESSHPLRLSYERGQVLPVHAGASAKVLLAFADPDEIDAVLASTQLRRFTSATVTSVTTLRRQLDQIRDAGYAVSMGEVDAGVVGISAPVFDADDRVVAALSVAAPAHRLDERSTTRLIAKVRAAAVDLSQRLTEVD